MSPPPARPVSRTAGAILLVAACLALSAGTASAGCGDYVRIEGQPAAHETVPSDTGAPKPPCHGPGCSLPPVPKGAPLTAPPTVEPGPKELASVAADGALGGANESRAAAPDDDGAPVSRPTDPFHPPRHV